MLLSGSGCADTEGHFVEETSSTIEAVGGSSYARTKFVKTKGGTDTVKCEE